MKYTLKQFQKEFPSDEAILDFIFRQKYPSKGYYRIKNRKSYVNDAGHQIHPLGGTIFEKTKTSLTSWFYAIYLFSVSKNGVSAKELERALGVTYKCAWRMGKQIRHLMADDSPLLSGVVEIDEAYLGSKVKKADRGKKTKIFGMVQRGGRVKAVVIPDLETSTLLNEIKKNVEVGSQIYSDKWKAYRKVKRHGYRHDDVKHSVGQYVKGKAHTNTIESFWSQLKRSFDGTYNGAISKKYLQNYINEFTYRHGRDVSSTFHGMVGKI